MTIQFKSDFFLFYFFFFWGGEGGYLFANFEPSQFKVGPKRGVPEKNHLTTCKAELGLSHMFVCLCWGLTSQSCRDGATASWVIKQYFRELSVLLKDTTRRW